MSTYILIHGAWHGAWCWEKIIPLLKAAGHDVFAPDLPGHGQDQTPILEISLDTYITSVMQLLDKLQVPVILVGHSMAGMIISQIAEHRPNQIKALVYLTAFLPQDGQSLFQVSQIQKPTRYVRQTRVIIEENIFYFPLSEMKDFAYHLCSAELYATIRDKFCQEPLKPMQEPVMLTQKHYGSVPKFYIECQQDRAILPETQARFYRKTSCQIIQLNTDHSPFYSDPLGLAKCLLDI